MDERDLIGNDPFWGRRPPLGPETKAPREASHGGISRQEPTADLTNQLQTLSQFLPPPRDRDSPPPSAAGSDAPIGEDAGWQVRDLLPAVSPAPRKEGRYHQKATLAELAGMFAPSIALLSLSKASGCITVREAWAAVPEPKPSYNRLNSVGDALGHGRGGHTLQLRRGARRGILVCQENVNTCVR